MTIKILPSGKELGLKAATATAKVLRESIQTKGQARIVAATGASQFAFLDALTADLI